MLIDSSDIRLRFCSETCRRLHVAGSRVGTTSTCRYCDEPFEVTNGKQVYCSKECRIRYNHRFGSASNLRRQAKKRGALLEGRFTLLDVARRDGWVCALCLSLIDPDVKDRRLQATVDHAVPIAAGGAHSFANAQLAHWVCNSAKRDRADVITMSVPSSSERVIIRGRIGSAAEVT